MIPSCLLLVLNRDRCGNAFSLHTVKQRLPVHFSLEIRHRSFDDSYRSSQFYPIVVTYTSRHKIIIVGTYALTYILKKSAYPMIFFKHNGSSRLIISNHYWRHYTENSGYVKSSIRTNNVKREKNNFVLRTVQDYFPFEVKIRHYHSNITVANVKVKLGLANTIKIFKKLTRFPKEWK